MGTKLPDKVKGAKATCFCGTPITCNEIDYQGETKLQWQNDDGKAHYQYDEATTKFSCRKDIPKQSSTVQAKLPPTTGEIRKEFERVYRDGLLTAQIIAKDICGPGATEKDQLVTAECIMKSYIHFFLAYAK